MGSKQANDGNHSQLGQGENGLWSTRPKPCCSKTYYRKRHRAVTLRKVARLSRSAQTGPEISSEGRRRDATETISAGDANHGLEITKEVSPTSDEGPAMDKNSANGGGSHKEAVQSSGKSHDADQGMGQVLANRNDVNHTRRSSLETLKIFPAYSTVPEKLPGDDLVGQTVTMNISDESAEVDKENMAVGVGSFAGYKTGTYVMGNSEVGDEGLENITPEQDSNNWVVDRCLEFYPKVGVTCEGEEKNMKMIFEDIEKTRQQSIVVEGGISTSSSGFDCYVNYERGMADVQQVQGRGRGRFGVL
jgi:hypothetical protein